MISLGKRYTPRITFFFLAYAGDFDLTILLVLSLTMGLNKNCLANDITCLIYQGPHAERRHDFLFLLLGLLRGLISLEVYNKKKIVDLILLLYIAANREGNLI